MLFDANDVNTSLDRIVILRRCIVGRLNFNELNGFTCKVRLRRMGLSNTRLASWIAFRWWHSLATTINDRCFVGLRRFRRFVTLFVFGSRGCEKAEHGIGDHEHRQQRRQTNRQTAQHDGVVQVRPRHHRQCPSGFGEAGEFWLR